MKFGKIFFKLIRSKAGRISLITLSAMVTALGFKNLALVFLGQYVGMDLRMSVTGVDLIAWTLAFGYLMFAGYEHRKSKISKVPTDRHQNNDSAARIVISRAA